VIRLGHKEKKTIRYKSGQTKEIEIPVQDNHFVLVDAPELIEVYGETPRELDVLLPFPDLLRNFDANYQVWAGGVLVCQGDGEFVQYATPFTVNLDSTTVRVYNAPGDTCVSNGVAAAAFDWNGTHFDPGDTVPCPGEARDMYPHCGACKLHGLLKVMMADPRLFRLGYYQVSTGSKRNYDTLMGILETLPAERLNGIPFKLRMVEEQTTYKDPNGQRKAVQKQFLQLEPDPGFTRQLYDRAAAAMLQAPAPLPALPAQAGPNWEDYDDAEPAAPPPLAQDQEPDEPATSENHEPEQAVQPHWTTVPERVAKFWKWGHDLTLTTDQILMALQVKQLTDYQKNAEDAMNAIQAWINQQLEQAEPPPPEPVQETVPA
jgi:hypothetical protein